VCCRRIDTTRGAASSTAPTGQVRPRSSAPRTRRAVGRVVLHTVRKPSVTPFAAAPPKASRDAGVIDDVRARRLEARVSVSATSQFRTGDLVEAAYRPGRVVKNAKLPSR